MHELEKELQRLQKPEPSTKFCQEAKDRLMHKISIYENETWFKSLLKKLDPVIPSRHFVQAARIRLMERVNAAKQPVFGWIVLAKRVVASTLVMAIAVTATLFFVGGKQPVSAAENTYLEVLSGEATVKHADQLIWDVITNETELTTGDLVQLSESSSAVIHFFDDTQLRLTGNSLLLLSRLDISPGYARQGVIEASLHEGRAWVQTLNVDDGYAMFNLVTPDAIISTNNASFDVNTDLVGPTSIRVFKHNVDIRALNRESRNIFAKGRLNSYQKVNLKSAAYTQQTVELDKFTYIADLAEEDRNEEWVVNNLQADKNHLADLRERELISLRNTTGTLPGQVLYPVKRAKERLNLVIRFDEGQKEAQIDMANSRLNESIVLIEQGEMQKAKIVLAEYQDIVRQIAEESIDDDEGDNEDLSNSVLTVHQKTLIAALPGDAQIGIVKQVLDETEELLAEDSIEKAEVRLQNSLEALTHVQEYIEAGDIDAAQELLEAHLSPATEFVDRAGEFDSDDEKKEFFGNVLASQHEERRLLTEISRILAKQGENSELADLVKATDRGLDDSIKYVAAAVRPLFPDISLTKEVTLPKDEKAIEFANKVNIYSTFTGQKNQISRLLKQYPQYASDMEFLVKLRSQLDTRAQDLVNARILELEKELKVAKGKRTKLKIDRAKQSMKMRAE